MWNRFFIMALVSVSMMTLPSPALGNEAAGAAPGKTSREGTGESVLTNAEVIKLYKLDLGEDVVIAKIDQAKKVNFKLETDDLVALKQAGVSKNVIAAMLRRSQVNNILSGRSMVGSIKQGDEGVLLRAGQKEVRLQSVQGDISRTWAYVTVLLFLDFPGLKAEVSTSDRKPTILVQNKKSPRGRIFFVKCESNQKTNNRSVKIGKNGMFSQGAWSSPDSDWVIECDTKQVSEECWELTPKEKLEPGEYGILFRDGFFGTLVGRGELFDFTVL